MVARAEVTAAKPMIEARRPAPLRYPRVYQPAVRRPDVRCNTGVEVPNIAMIIAKSVAQCVTVSGTDLEDRLVVSIHAK